MSFDKEKYDAEYLKSNYQTLTIRLSKTKDADLIKYLNSIGRSKNSYVKELLRNNIRWGDKD